MTNIIIKITAWYLRDNRLDNYYVDYEVDRPEKHGFVNSFKGSGEIADAVLSENARHRIPDPVYNIMLKEGSHPLRKVKKYSDYERYTAKPPENIKKELTDLLKNGVMITNSDKRKD